MVLNIHIHKATDKNRLHLQAENFSPGPSMIQLTSCLLQVWSTKNLRSVQVCIQAQWIQHQKIGSPKLYLRE